MAVGGSSAVRSGVSLYDVAAGLKVSHAHINIEHMEKCSDSASLASRPRAELRWLAPKERE